MDDCLAATKPNQSVAFILRTVPLRSWLFQLHDENKKFAPLPRLRQEPIWQWLVDTSLRCNSHCMAWCMASLVRPSRMTCCWYLCITWNSPAVVEYITPVIHWLIGFPGVLVLQDQCAHVYRYDYYVIIMHKYISLDVYMYVIHHFYIFICTYWYMYVILYIIFTPYILLHLQSFTYGCFS